MTAQPKKPIGRPRGEQVENAARRRRQVVEAAIESIVERGMSKTTLATVSAAAGLSQGVAVFYFKSKENLLVETLRHHYEEYTAIWTAALDRAPTDDPVAQLTHLVLADLDPKICTPANLALWNSFWGEVGARPAFRDVCDHYDTVRQAAMRRVCDAAASRFDGALWTSEGLSDTLDAMTDGMWIRMHITPGYLSAEQGRTLLRNFLCTVFPQDRDTIQQGASDDR